MSERSYLLKISLLYIEPEIWRCFVVPAAITLEELHEVIQIVMGWHNSHLHEFIIARKLYSASLDLLDEDGVEDGADHRLGDVVKRKGATMRYVYDFGDNWEHKLVVEDGRHVPKTGVKLSCLDGEGVCPPEDIGGPPGYYRFREVMQDPDHAEHEQYKEWYGEYDMERVDIEAINRRLKSYRLWSLEDRGGAEQSNGPAG